MGRWAPVLKTFYGWLCILQNDAEKSASEPGTPPQTSKPAELKSTSKSPKSSPKTSPKSAKAPEVTFWHWTLICFVHTYILTVRSTAGSCHNRPSTSRVTDGRVTLGKRWVSTVWRNLGQGGRHRVWGCISCATEAGSWTFNESSSNRVKVDWWYLKGSSYVGTESLVWCRECFAVTGGPGSGWSEFSFMSFAFNICALSFDPRVLCIFYVLIFLVDPRFEGLYLLQNTCTAFPSLNSPILQPTSCCCHSSAPRPPSSSLFCVLCDATFGPERVGKKRHTSGWWVHIWSEIKCTS